MTTLISLAIAVLGRLDPAPLTMDIAACRIEVLAAKIEEASHVHLEVAPNLKGEVVGIRVKDAKLDDLLPRIGKVMYATWVPIPGGQRLEQTPTQHLQEQQVDHANRLAKCRAALGKLKIELAKLPPLTNADLIKIAKGQTIDDTSKSGNKTPTQSMSSGAELVQRQPILRLMKRVAAAVTPELLANMADEDRVVLSSSPTRMQRPLEFGMMAAVNDFVGEQNRFAATIAAMPKPKPRPTGTDDEEAYDPINMLEFGGRAEGIVKMRLVLKSSAMGEGVQVEMRLLRADGSEAFTNETSIETGLGGLMRSSESTEAGDEDGRAGVPRQIEPKGPDIELSATTKAFMAELRNFSGRSEPSFSPELAAKFLDPVTYEPLAIFASDFALGASPGKNVVARLSDNSIIPIATKLMDDHIPVSKAREVLTNQASELIEEADGWATITPAFPSATRHQRCDRTRLRSFLGALHDPSLGLDQYADLAHGLPGPMENPLVTLAVLFSGANYMGLLEQSPDWLTLQFYGALSTPQRRAMQTGRTLVIGQLSGEARAILDRLIFIVPSGLSTTPNLDNNDRPSANVLEIGPNALPELEPTEVLANGIVPNSLVHGQMISAVVGAPVTPNSMLAPGPMSPDELGFLIENSDAISRVPTVITKFHMGRKETVTFDFQFGPSVFSRQQVSHAAVGVNEVELSAFPPEFVRAVEEARKLAKQQRTQEGQAPRRASPPPR